MLTHIIPFKIYDLPTLLIPSIAFGVFLYLCFPGLWGAEETVSQWFDDSKLLEKGVVTVVGLAFLMIVGHIFIGLGNVLVDRMLIGKCLRYPYQDLLSVPATQTENVVREVNASAFTGFFLYVPVLILFSNKFDWGLPFTFVIGLFFVAACFIRLGIPMVIRTDHDDRRRLRAERYAAIFRDLDVRILVVILRVIMFPALLVSWIYYFYLITPLFLVISH